MTPKDSVKRGSTVFQSRNSRLIGVACDLVVVGGGLAGVCAAIAGARNGLRTALIQDRPVLGGNSSSEVRVNPRGAGFMGNAWARESGIIEELILDDRARNHEQAGIGTMNSMWDLALYDSVMREKLLSLYLNTHVFETKTHNNRIMTVTGVQQGSERRFLFTGSYFVDATGDGSLGFLAGADYRFGREARSEFGESMAPIKSDNLTQSSTLLFRARDMGRPVPYVPPSWAARYDCLKSNYAARLRGFFNNGDYGGFLWIEIGAPWNPIDDNNAIGHECLRHVLGVWNFIKNSGKYPEADNLALDWIGTVPGKRESRRLMGDHILTQNDIRKTCPFDDAVAYGGWWIDVHKPGGILAKGNYIQQFRPGIHEAIQARVYPIPLRCLYSRNIRNLFMAGRNISATHCALGSARVMCTLAVIGQAVGTAAAVAYRYKVSPRNAGRRHIREIRRILLKDDAFIPGYGNDDPEDLARPAMASVSSESSLRLEPVKGQFRHPGGAQIFPVNSSRLESICLFVESTSALPSEMELAIMRVRDMWDYRMPASDTPRFKTAVPSGYKGWLKFETGLDIPAPGLYQFVVNGHRDLLIACADRWPGTDSAWRHVKWKRRWMGKQAVMAMRIDPAQTPFTGSNVLSGTARPDQWTNIWISDPARKMPQRITLNWPEPVLFNTVCLTFDTNLNIDPPELPAFWRAPECIRDYRLEIRQDKRWKRIVTANNNYQRRRVHRFLPMQTDAMRLVVTATNGDASARVYEIRVYLEHIEGTLQKGSRHAIS